MDWSEDFQYTFQDDKDYSPSISHSQTICVAFLKEDGKSSAVFQYHVLYFPHAFFFFFFSFLLTNTFPEKLLLAIFFYIVIAFVILVGFFFPALSENICRPSNGLQNWITNFASLC